MDKRDCDFSGLQLRPNAGSGLWLALILPTAVIISTLKHPIESSHLYKLCTVFALGLLLSAIIFISYYQKFKRIYPGKVRYFMAGVAVSTVFFIFFGKGVSFSCYSGFSSTLLFYKTYLFVLKHFPLCFTLGEAFIITQSFLLYLFSTVVNVIERINRPPITTLQISTMIIQMGLFCIGLLCFLPYKWQSFRKTSPFYFLASSVILILLLSLHVVLRTSPLLWIFQMIFTDLSTIKLVVYWCVCCAIAVGAIYKQIQGAKKASTTVRKIFHILAVAVFLPGLIHRCCLIYLASGIVLGIFVAVELLRILNLPPLGIFLQDGFFVFSDDKDAGAIAFTPLYLLAGCSAPIWIHPAPCDLTDSAGTNLLPLLSGILSVGIGDTAASYVGSRVGKHKWPGTSKSFEGTLACIVSQFLAVFILVQLGYVNPTQSEIYRLIVAVIVTSVIEAKSTQVDNLFLPLLMYIILIT